MHHRVLRVGQDESLEVEECQIIVPNQVGTFSSVYVCLLKSFV